MCAGCCGLVEDVTFLSYCTSLEVLTLSSCRLAAFPEMVFGLRRLCCLDLGSNQIAFVPDSITQLQVLSRLDMSNNNLSSLPPSLGLLPLRALLVDGNAIKTVRRAVLDRGTEHVLAYLRDKLPEGSF
jgi:Leucine rich repeat